MSVELDHDPITMRPFIDGAGTHVPPRGADWEPHTAGLDCLAHMEASARGETHDNGGRITAPTWRDRLADRPPMADWYRRRHHCSDVVLGSHWHAAQHGEDDQLPF